MLKKRKNVLKSPINTQQIRLLRQFQHIREIFSVKKGLFVPKLREKSNFSGNFDTLFRRCAPKLCQKFLQAHSHIRRNTQNSVFFCQVSRMNDVRQSCFCFEFLRKPGKGFCRIIFAGFYFNRKNLEFQLAVI